MFNREAPSEDQEWVTIGDGRAMKVLCVGSLKLHGDTGIRVHLPRVHVVDGLAINISSLDAVQVKHPITLDSAGVHLYGGNIAFPREDKSSFLRTARL